MRPGVDFWEIVGCFEEKTNLVSLNNYIMAAKKESNIPAEKLALYDKLVATNRDVERKGDTVPYTSLNGHMFSYINTDGSVVLRLSKKDQEAFVAKYKTVPVMSYGALKKDWVNVPDELLKKTKELKKYFDKSYEYVGTLKPKK
jgi:hypothetical protein